MIQQFISDLKSVPREEYKKFFVHAKKVAIKYPLNEGIDCFARGETIEWAFIKEFSKYIQIKSSEKNNVNDPDGVYKEVNLFDIKTKKEGFLPQKSDPSKFYVKSWDFKKTQSGVDEFVTKAEWYVLIDPWTYRLAVLDVNVIKNKNINKGEARITFSVSPKDVIMIYDGINELENLYVTHQKEVLYEMIWNSVD
jgi:hypothetical protein